MNSIFLWLKTEFGTLLGLENMWLASKDFQINPGSYYNCIHQTQIQDLYQLSSDDSS